MRSLSIMVVGLLVLAVTGCSDDGAPPRDTGHAGDGRSDTLRRDSNALPWPDWPASKDLQAWTCTAGQAGMCDDNKRFYCKSGTCARCPENFLDCDRTGECECAGACTGTKCVGGK